ncbi:HD-GYP domain-containing protein [Sphingobium sp. Sx8-8]|uniref:HD-GYP domain-containing protein n=1 Tax=Sphingobium sp. Sx8-8 TaxID=2933617 RepID=UPI002479D054|nr:HD-GYP domain-containing protein [Sphingobium sp. Sx8-8]
MLISIDPYQVTMGMYVHAFKGSWFNHPFWRPRFVITDMDVLDRIRASDVEAVIIDSSKGKGPESKHPPAAMDVRGSPLPATRSLQSRSWSAPREKVHNREMEQARQIISRGKQIVTRLFDEARLGRLAVTPDVLTLVDDISRSLERSRSTLLNMARLKNKDEYTYLHSVAVCALMVNFARQLGMDEDRVRDLGISGLMHDVGKMAVPLDILNKAGRLSDDEFALVKDHTLSGRTLLEQCEGMPQTAIDVALHHHERMDGTGYPFGIGGAQLSVAARMGAICDIYDALTSERIYKEAWTPSEAIARMSGWTGHLDEKLLFAFMQGMNLYPPGILVRLRSNRLAIALPNGRRGSRAKARAFYAIPERAFIPAEDIPLSDHPAGDQIISLEEPAHWPLVDWSSLQDDILLNRYRPPHY